MHRTEADNNIEVGGLKQYTDGPPGTTLVAVDKNTIQEEIAAVIEGAGLTLKTVSTETNDQLIAGIQALIAAEAPSAIQAVDWSSKNLIISNITNTTIDVDADELSFINSSNILAFDSDINETFDITTDLMAGTAEKVSHWYQLWLDSAGVRLTVPDLTGTADANVLNSLSASAMTFQTDLVQVDDEIYQTTDNTKGYVKAVSGEGLLTCKDKDGADLDLFPLGTETFKIHQLSPTGLGSYKANIGAAYNNAAGNFDNSRKNGQARITNTFWRTVNGYGSSSIQVQKFTTEIDVSDDVVVTIINSATLGFVITANMACKLDVTLISSTSTAGFLGLSKNSSELTTAIQSLTTAADRVAIDRINSTDIPVLIHWKGIIAAGDVVRPHSNGVVDGTDPDLGAIIVVAEEII